MNNIQKYRGLKGISQIDFSKQLGMTRPGLSFVENGNVKIINYENLKKMSEILEVSPIMLLGEENFKYLPETKEDVDFMIDILLKIKENL